MAVHEYRPPAPKKPPPPKFPVPWGLVVVLAVYALAVVGYIWKTYWESPGYQAAEHYAQALALLGVDDGRKSSAKDLEAAFGHVLEAARLVPEDKGLAQHTERLRWRFEERRFKLNPDLVRKSELVSKAAQRIEEERAPWLAIGSRDRGWAPDQLLAGPERVVWWSSPGVVLIIAVWVYGQFGAKKAREREHEENLRKDEAAAKALGAWREGLGQRPADEDDATIAEAVPAARPRTTGSGRRAVERTSSPGRSAVSKSSSGTPSVSKSSGSRPAVRPKTEGDDES